jgi:hypothetical protein
MEEMTLAPLSEKTISYLKKRRELLLPESSAMVDVILQREHQIIRCRYTLEHDDDLIHGELVKMAVKRCEAAISNEAPYRDSLVKAAALLIAEIERYDREPF